MAQGSSLGLRNQVAYKVGDNFRAAINGVAAALDERHADTLCRDFAPWELLSYWKKILKDGATAVEDVRQERQRRQEITQELAA